jgi:hypothetical protein
MSWTIARGRRLFAVAAVTIALSVASYCLWLVYAPEHCMTPVRWATVSVDGHHVPADFYIGDPTHYEAEAFLLAHVPGTGDYMLSFGNERYREARPGEYIRVSREVWVLKPLQSEIFVSPLPLKRVNEHRIMSRGHFMTIDF